MKCLCFLCLLVSSLIHVDAQGLSPQASKPPIDSNVYDKWPSVERAAISNNGKYVLYFVKSATDFIGGINKLVLQSTNAAWKLEISNAANASFTQDSRFVIFIKGKDSIGIATLGNDSVEYIPEAFHFKMPKQGIDEWLFYVSQKSGKKLIGRNLHNNKEIDFGSVNNYFFSSKGKIIVFETDSIQDGSTTKVLHVVNLEDGSKKSIWSNIGIDLKVENVVFDKLDTQIAFSVIYKNNNHAERDFYYYKIGNDKASLLMNNQSRGIDSTLELDQVRKFSNDCSRLFFTLKEKEYFKAVKDAVQVNIWSYADDQLQSYQLKNNDVQHFTASINIEDLQIVRLAQNNEVVFPSGIENQNDNFAMLSNNKGDNSERNWNPSAQIPACLISTIDGTRKWQMKKEYGRYYTISPKAKYIIYYYVKQKNFFSYEIASGITRNITTKISTQWTRYMDDHVDAKNICYPVIGWLNDDKAVLLNDQNDIWLVDPVGQKPPINITNEYGRKHNIFFELMGDYAYKAIAIADNEKLLLAAFNRDTKENGFYSKIINKKGNPKKLSMGSYFYYAVKAADRMPDGANFTPIKAHDENIYLVRRMSATEAPNYFCTKDFIEFRQLSNLSPEKEYNWLTTELHTWKDPDGRLIQGLLYKPENFDAKKKYPVILHYYETKSNALNVYLKPEAASGDINIPYFVSNGYIIFTPDIHYKAGETGGCALKSVVSAAKYISKMPFINTKKIGIQGMSFGGFETNYLITHTNIFRAACTAAGVSNFISAYDGLRGNILSSQQEFEIGQYRIGVTLWKRPDLYIDNSPVLRADKVKTPLLMMHTTGDGAVPFSQAMEFFTALRRLGKKVWMLEYNDGDHAISGKSARDYSIRLIQFFNYYLKDAPPPKWMTQGVPAKLKGIDTGFKLDISGKKP